MFVQRMDQPPTGSAALAKGDVQIVPARRIGCFLLGMTVDELLRVLGDPDIVVAGTRTYTRQDAPPCCTFRYPRARLAFCLDAGRVAEISTADERFVLAGGIAVGGSREAALEALGPGQTDEAAPKPLLRYPGLLLELDDTGAFVRSIVIRRSAPGAPLIEARHSPSRRPSPSPPASPRLLNPLADGHGTRVILHRRDDEALRQGIERLDTLPLPGGSHGLDHALRVGALCLAFHSQLEPDSEDGWRYFLMGYLHDVGRSDDSRDARHAPASAARIAELDLALGAPLLAAIAAHDQPRPPRTPQEVCLFDADRLDLVRLGRTLDARMFSAHRASSLEALSQLQRVFVRNRWCCFIPCLLRGARALELWLQLDRHLGALDSPLVFHGSARPGLTTIEPRRRTFPLDGAFLYATKDFYEAYHIAAERTQREVSVYALERAPLEQTIYSVRNVEYVSSRPLPVVREVRCVVEPGLSPFGRYLAALDGDLAGWGGASRRRGP
jgi:hypothetical protein